MDYQRYQTTSQACELLSWALAECRVNIRLMNSPLTLHDGATYMQCLGAHLYSMLRAMYNTWQQIYRQSLRRSLKF